MKRLYVVYDGNDRPFAECEKFRDAYIQAKECLRNDGGYVSIDIYLRDGARGYTHKCEDGDFYFMDRKGGAICSSDLSESGILRYSVTPEMRSQSELEILSRIATCFELELNETGLDVYKKVYSFKRGGRGEKSQS